MPTVPRRFIALAFGLATIVASPAIAQSAGPAAPAAPFAAAALGDDALGGIAGREDVNQNAVANLNAGVSRNSVGDNSTTGDAKIADNAFQNLSGLSILNVNTGNNVAINAAMNVNITISPGQ